MRSRKGGSSHPSFLLKVYKYRGKRSDRERLLAPPFKSTATLRKGNCGLMFFALLVFPESKRRKRRRRRERERATPVLSSRTEERGRGRQLSEPEEEEEGHGESETGLDNTAGGGGEKSARNEGNGDAHSAL